MKDVPGFSHDHNELASDEILRYNWFAFRTLSRCVGR